MEKQKNVTVTNETQEVVTYTADTTPLPTLSESEKSLHQVFEDVSQTFYCSIVNDGSREAAIKIYNAMNNTHGSIRDLEHAIVVTDLIAHNITLMDEQTGELTEGTRVVLITEDGKGYHAVAQGIVSSIQKIVGIVGRAPWNPGVKMKPRLVKTRKGFYTLTIELMV